MLYVRNTILFSNTDSFEDSSALATKTGKFSLLSWLEIKRAGLFSLTVGEIIKISSYLYPFAK